MFRTLNRTIRNTVRLAAIVFAALVTVDADRAFAQQQNLRFKENNRIEANGDGHFNFELKLPLAKYTELKKNTPNTALFLRKLGVSAETGVVENVQGSWDDGNSTMKIEYTIRGAARAGKDSRWEVALFDSNEPELVAVTDGTAVLTQAMNVPGLGLATSTIRVKLPAGATKVTSLSNPGRLAYEMPVPAATGMAKTEFEVDSKPQLMAAIAKAHANPKFRNLYAASSRFVNSGGRTLTDYRVRFRIAEYAPTWSPLQGTPVVVAGQTVVDRFFPVFDMDKIGKLTGSVKAALEVEYQYDAGNGPVKQVETKTITLLSRNQVFYTGLKPEDCVDFHDWKQLSEVVLGSFVTHEDSVIQQAAGRIANSIGGANSSSSDAEAEKFMKAAYDFMSMNIAYQTPPSIESDRKLVQHVKYGRDVLRNKAGTCIDLAILYGSLCEAVGLEPILYMIPGHCFPAVRFPVSGKIIPVEATMIGKGDFLAANKYALDTNLNPMLQGKIPFILCDIAKLHNNGVQPIDLPATEADALAKWGMDWNFVPAVKKVETAKVPVNQPNPAPVAKLNENYFGTWTNTGTQDGKTVAETFKFFDDGTFLILLDVDGTVTRVPGTYTPLANGVRLKYKSNGKTNDAKIVLKAKDTMVITLDEGSSSEVHRQ